MSSAASAPEVEYPSDDGLPMSDNTLQFQWIKTLADNFEILFRGRRDVFVGGNLLWYPVEGQRRVRRAPDGFVVFGRPPGHRSSYLQWQEDDVPMTVVFEVRSPNDGDRLMRTKRAFDERHGVEEYYVIDPDRITLEVYRRRGDRLARQAVPPTGYVSPRLGVRLTVDDTEVRVYYPDGSDFVRAVDLVERAEAAEAERDERIDDLEESEDQRQQAVARLARLAELTQRILRGTATADEIAEASRLTASPE